MQPALGDRSLFPRLEARAYLAHAAVAPLSRPVVDGMQELIELGAHIGFEATGTLAERADLAADRFAALVGTAPENIARVANTSTGVTAISTAFDFAPGDRVVVFDGEFPTNVTPWAAAAEPAGAELVRVPVAPFLRSHAEGLAAFDAAVDERVRLIAVSAVQFQSGLAMPLAELAQRARALGAKLFVDGIQGVGARPIDVEALGIDYLSCGGHKWLGGPLGTAYLYVAPAAREELRPRQIGWISHEDAFIFLNAANELRYDRPLQANARAFETGVLNFAGLAGSAAALELLLELSPASIFEHLQAWHDAIEPGVEALGWRSLRSAEPAGRSGILSFAPPDPLDPAEVVTRLGQRGIVATPPDGCLRLAPHWSNPLSEVPFVLEQLERATWS
ncbi:MAG: aminotransferase class V-fold PLP-dependent enzyme [Planctomycetota bacterium]